MKGKSDVNGLRDAVQEAVRGIPVAVKAEGRGQATPSHTKRLRARHHTIARMVAAGLPSAQICKSMGLTWSTLEQLVEQTPAFQELVAKYRADGAPLPEFEGYLDVLERAMLAAELEIADRVLEDPEKLSISELHKVSRDAADRLGYSKHSVNLNVNITLAERLEGLRRRNRAPAGAGDGGGGALSAESSPRSPPPPLELRAEPVPGQPSPGRYSLAPKPMDAKTAAMANAIRPANTTRPVPPPPDPTLRQQVPSLDPKPVPNRLRPAPAPKDPIPRRI